MHRLQEFVRLHRQGRSSREIAHLLRISRKTIRRYSKALTKAGLLDGSPADLRGVDELVTAVRELLPASQPSKQSPSVAKWLSVIEPLVLEKSAGPASVYDFLRLEHRDFDGSLSAVKRACAQILKGLLTFLWVADLPLSDPQKRQETPFVHSGIHRTSGGHASQKPRGPGQSPGSSSAGARSFHPASTSAAVSFPSRP